MISEIVLMIGNHTISMIVYHSNFDRRFLGAAMKSIRRMAQMPDSNIIKDSAVKKKNGIQRPVFHWVRI